MDISDVARPPETLGRYWFPDDIDNKRNIVDDTWQLINSYRIGLPDGRLIIIPSMFIYDKASAPQAVWWYVSRDDKHIERAALVHDFLYEHQGIEGEWIKREEADNIFYEIMKQEGMRYGKRALVYRAVRMFGGSFFNPRARANGNIHYQ